MECNELITLIKDIMLIIAALITSFAALRGLNAWKIKLQGQSDYDLARRLLITSFQYRDAIYAVRSPLFWNYEMPTLALDEEKTMSDAQKTFHQNLEMYKNRLDKVQNERKILYPDLLESEAVWGTELKNNFSELFKQENELLNNIQTFLELKNPDRPHDKATLVYNMKTIGPIILSSSDEKDIFKKTFEANIKIIEKYLKPKLLQKK
jgi:hypothetical protein